MHFRSIKKPALVSQFAISAIEAVVAAPRVSLLRIIPCRYRIFRVTLGFATFGFVSESVITVWVFSIVSARLRTEHRQSSARNRRVEHGLFTIGRLVCLVTVIQITVV
jgi:hypothetical protein